jgi:hypothetical protein
LAMPACAGRVLAPKLAIAAQHGTARRGDFYLASILGVAVSSGSLLWGVTATR